MEAIVDVHSGHREAYLESSLMLNDLLRPNLCLVICGTAAGKTSAQSQEYYAGRGNGFWQVLYETGLTGRVMLQPGEFRRLLEFGIGLTDLAKSVAGNDKDIPRASFDSRRLRETIREIQPRVLAFNGKKAASIFFGRATGAINYGRQQERIGRTKLWVVPSTSAAARGHWDKGPWQDLADAILFPE